MDVMKPIASTDIPTGDDWLYEVKYDGFRCVLDWGKNGDIHLTSKNKHDLTPNFPEIVAYCKEMEKVVVEMLPLKLDGELVILNNPYQANFSAIQKRGRLKNKESIEKSSSERAATFMVFDLLTVKGKTLQKLPFEERKQKLVELVEAGNFKDRIKLIEAFSDPKELWNIVFDSKGEGMIAKRKKGVYGPGKGHRDWYKIKNWRTFQAILTAYDSKNEYFSVEVFQNDELVEVGKCKHGLDSEAFQTVQKLFLTNGDKRGDTYRLPPAICASIHTLDIYRGELREPEFKSLLPNLSPEECTLSQFEIDMALLPTSVDISKTDKLYWPETNRTKGELLTYMREISPYMLPFLQNRALTIIRCPDGINEESFFQKHLPSYAPSYIKGVGKGDEKLIVCDSLDSLVWFANHGSIEFHVPFQYITSNKPLEIVFDLDPPDRSKFHWAIEASKIIRQLLDDLNLISFIKTSGNKGLQIHIPIPEGTMSYEETAVFTQAIAWTVENQKPDWFTTERMKNKRNGRLYIDYVQHGKDKTIIAPYSPRKTKEASIATPLFWEEVTEHLRPEQFTIKNGVERVQSQGCPFANFYKVGKHQDIDMIVALIK
ncbi:DNA ligase D [Ornithinibacillus halophilus]|uniref:DNA ligase (ATP) n=1 Tax=Ornithinibacillus halophilus TaxID=930117 RepID=A0A1M5JF74_9BACI|nr:DNA ligase D [Ornithinibacillus halophilus]SHG38929.1 bifunctional non-homologous end joining protein LigD [Ornithinibacillus halophilus]